MLREIKRTRQDAPEQHKRWFTDQDMDLFVWSVKDYETDENAPELERVVKFQLSLNKQSRELAITWQTDGDVEIYEVDEGSRPGKHPSSPIFVDPESDLNSDQLAQIKRSLSNVDYKTASFLIDKISQKVKTN